MTNKRIDLGEYIITISYDEKTGQLDVAVLDELGDMIEAINIVEDDDDAPSSIELNLN